VLAGAVALCLPMAPGIIDGAIGAVTALTRFLLALLACWVAGAVLSTVLTRYNEESRRAEIIRVIEAAQRSAAGGGAAGATDGAAGANGAGGDGQGADPLGAGPG